MIKDVIDVFLYKFIHNKLFREKELQIFQIRRETKVLPPDGLSE